MEFLEHGIIRDVLLFGGLVVLGGAIALILQECGWSLTVNLSREEREELDRASGGESSRWARGVLLKAARRENSGR